LAATEATDVEARPGAEVTLHPFDGMGEAVAFIADALRSLIGREPSASVALLTRHAGQADAWWGALARAEVPQLRRVRRQDFAFACFLSAPSTLASNESGLAATFFLSHSLRCLAMPLICTWILLRSATLSFT